MMNKRNQLRGIIREMIKEQFDYKSGIEYKELVPQALNNVVAEIGPQNSKLVNLLLIVAEQYVKQLIKWNDWPGVDRFGETKEFPYDLVDSIDTMSNSVTPASREAVAIENMTPEDQPIEQSLAELLGGNDIYKRVELLLDNFAKDMAREYYKDYYYESN